MKIKRIRSAINYSNKIHIDLFKLGFVPNLKLKKVKKIIEKSTNGLLEIKLSANKNITTPDNDEWYYFENLYNNFPQNRGNSNYQVAIIRSPLYDGKIKFKIDRPDIFFGSKGHGKSHYLSFIAAEFKTLKDRRENSNNLKERFDVKIYNLYAQSNKKKIILTTYHSQGILKQINLSIEQYIALILIEFLIWSKYHSLNNYERTDFSKLYHEITNNCIFDYSNNLIDKKYGLKSGNVCQKCRNLLKDFIKNKLNKKEDIILFKNLQSITKNITRIRFLDFLKSSFNKPYFSLIIGAFLGGLFINILSSVLTGSVNSLSIISIIVIGILIIAIPTIIYTKEILRHYSGMKEIRNL